MLIKNKIYLTLTLLIGSIATCVIFLLGFSNYFMGYANIKPKVIQLDCPPVRDGFGGIVAVDVNNDSYKELVVTKNEYLGVFSVSGKKLWSIKADILLSDGYGWLPGSHCAGVQAADIDGVGLKELLYLTTQNELHIVAGNTGRSIRRISIPPIFRGSNHRWEHMIVANFRGHGDSDLFLQATEATEKKAFRVGCYVAAYSLDDLLKESNPQPLWFRDDYIGPAHGGARVADLDGDGRDEVLGATLIGSSGNILFKIPVGETPADHIDAIHAADIRPDIPGIEVVALQETHGTPGMGNQVFLYNPKGLIWKAHSNHQEPQNAAIGDFDPEQDGLEVWCRSRFDRHQKPFVINSRGEVFTNYELDKFKPLLWSDKGVEVVAAIHWTGEERQYVAAKERHHAGDIAIFNPISGKFMHRFKEKADRIFVADVLGDWREEIIVLNANYLRIYANETTTVHKNKDSLWTQRLYLRNKMTWNYYNT